MLFVVPVVLFDMLKAKQLACVSESGQKCPAARSLSLRRAWIEIRSLRRRGRRHESLFLRRAWIEMSLGSSYLTASLCRSPYGEHGLKSTGAGARRRSGVFLQVGIHSIGTIFQQHRQLVSNRNCDVGIRHPFLPSYLVMRACSLR